jgi:hypothetical protein
MAAVLTAASVLVCPHNFPFKVIPGQHLFTVDGEFLIVGADLVDAPIATCTNPVNKCTKINSVTAGLSSTLAIDGEQVVLDTAAGITDAAPGWHVQSAGQAKLEAK